MRSVVVLFCISLASSALAQAPVNGAGNRKQATATRVPNGSIHVDGRLDDEAWQKAMLSKIPLNRFGELDDLVGASVFLVSDAACYITGVCLPVDGGALASL